ncbi:hypothetical protein [Chloroflexus sp. MS-G]|jgi:hypothetical protein|uniref:hypothetical protein n=1 Tax=Chloroflexus sp. MS-G TaxID=1521187 RepID=UPI000AD3D2AE|nr:hypothetical protein [Chloroflexus sp. MS-G]
MLHLRSIAWIGLLIVVVGLVAPAMVRFILEGHGLLMEENQLYAAQEQISWFRRHLK